eukprot:12894030-Prorocentrum_lima.AAC.1
MPLTGPGVDRAAKKPQRVHEGDNHEPGTGFASSIVQAEDDDAGVATRPRGVIASTPKAPTS